MIEIERKFLVTSSEFKSVANKRMHIRQAYLSSNPARSVRIRIQDEKGFITIKGKSNKSGLSRFEWEKEIPAKEAETLLDLCEAFPIEKNRFLVKFGEHVYEVDEFYAENQGLIIAEIELASEDENFLKPEWLGREVTGDKRYYNAHLSKFPFTEW
ncbi:MAG TPA: CYTH domain-containing protein [Flavobacteriaceae bacterium]|nr:CYTH domain-containing protein [Flavobacteriaceae bacterium]